MKSSRRSQHRKKKRKMKSSKNQPTRTPIALMLAAMASKPLTDLRGTTTIVRNNSAPTRPRPAMALKAPSSLLLRAEKTPRVALSTRSVRGLDATKAKATEAAEIAHTTGLVALERVILKAAKARKGTTKGAVAVVAEEAGSRRLLKRAKEINKSN